MSVVLSESLEELQAQVRKRSAFLRSQVGAAADYRCGVCRKMASDHIGDVITDCHDRELPDDQFLESLQGQ